MDSSRVAWLVALVALACEVHAQAPIQEGPPAGDLMWRCWFNPPMHASCTLESLPHRQAVETPPASLPGFVRLLRARPESLRHRFVHIPLHNHPFGLEGVADLASAVMCGTRQDCRVRFLKEPPDAEALEFMMDPLYAIND